MVEINLNAPTPSQAIINAASATVVVTDAKGRAITLTRLKPLDRMRLFEAVGAENVHNDAYFGYASLAYHVTAIDGVPAIQPRNNLQLEALVQLLDDDGLAAIAAGIAEHFVTEKKSDSEVKEALKNV